MTGRGRGGPDRRGLLAALAAVVVGLPLRGSGWAQPVPPPPSRPVPPGRPAAPPAPAAPTSPPADPRPGVPAPPAVVEEIRAAIARAVERFQARDADGVMALVSEAYWTGPFGKRTVRAQLVTLYQLHQQVRARVELNEVRLVGAHAWVWTSGEVSGQVALVGQWLGLFQWERELEVARREQGVWRLYGYQQ
jgi:hypothetical protein